MCGPSWKASFPWPSARGLDAERRLWQARTVVTTHGAASTQGRSAAPAHRATLLRLPARWNAPDEQLALVRSAVARGETDLLLFPEASLTGYVSEGLECDLTTLAEPLEAGTRRLAELARALACDVVGPVIERADEATFNALVGVGPDGHRWLHYRKRHPWYPERWATPGDTPYPLVDWRGLRLTAAICFDVHFLPDEAEDVLERADALLFPSAWVDGGESRATLLQRLATRFGLTVLNANWGPGAPSVPGQGPSLVAWADGSTTTGAALRLDVRLPRLKPRR